MTGKISAKGIAQRQQAARTHGLHALERRGEAALDEGGRSRLIELRELSQDRSGVIEMLKERAARATLIAELAESWVQKEVEAGKQFDEIGLLRRLGTYQETSRRALSCLLAALPKDKASMDITELLRGDTDDIS